MMDPISLKKEILGRIDTLSYELQRKLLEYIDFLTQKVPKGIPGKQLLKFAGSISQGDLKAMEQAIEDGCERIDAREW
jgi:hypothetical protein